MTEFFFFLFATMVIGGAASMVLQRNSLNSAMSMIVSLLGVAGIFLLLEAYLLSVLQIVVYAGAVMVLILFIVMLMDVDSQAKKAVRMCRVLAGLFFFALLVAAGAYVLKTCGYLNLTEGKMATVSEGSAVEYSTGLKEYGYLLFSKYMLVFQTVAFLLFAAMVGVIVISKKYVAEEDANKEEIK